MQTYYVRLQSEVSKSFKAELAAQSLDIDTEKKSLHELSITADITSAFSVGVIVGSSGSGKTTLAKQIFGEGVFKSYLDLSKAVIDQFPEIMTYDECAAHLMGIGLTAVPCWIKPAYTLSNGQRFRAEAALAMIHGGDLVVIDEWTSVVDRTVAKVMSHCVQKFARKFKKKIILLSCHYDVLEWLDPDWVIDCNHQKFIDRRLLQRSERERKERLTFDIREIGRDSWRYFSKYHYLSERLPGGKIYLYGLFCGGEQVGFQCFANYVPIRKGSVPILHFNRTVIHPDYAGLGLGIKLINETSRLIRTKGFKVMGKFSSIPVYRAMMKDPNWRVVEIRRQIGRTKTPGPSMFRKSGFRENIKTFSFEFIGK